MEQRQAVINSILQANENENPTYLEIGYGDGKHYQGIQAKDKICVDPNSSAAGVHKMTSDDFFAQNAAKFDVVFIDGEHNAAQVEKDLINAYNNLNKGGAVILHDCNPHNEGMQAVPRAQREWTGDVWKVCYGFIAEYGEVIKHEYNDSDPYGLFIIYKTGNRKLREGFTTSDLTFADYKGYAAE